MPVMAVRAGAAPRASIGLLIATFTAISLTSEAVEAAPRLLMRV